ncbi:MAG: caspase family protein [Xanthobacteraceae bacterium]|nr:caspase family protein [Xanthobacteraceae bacterium]MBV9628901.1 caspase family protein [Xanthobacteraceae bacterium]
MRLVFILLASLIIVPGNWPANAEQTTAADAQTRIALVIGNANYQDADTPLKDPVGDARALGSALERAGFDVDVAEDLTKDAMRRTLDRFYDKVKPGAMTLIFFSGYGIQSNRQNYLIPTDAHIWTESDVRRDGMSIAAILSELGNRQPSAAIAVLEAARRNPFERRYRLTSAGLAAITAAPGTLIAHAAAPNALLDDTNRGLFVGELIKQIGKADSPVQDVFNRTSLAVSQASQGGQIPWVSSALDEQISFGEKSTTAPATSQSKMAAVEPAKPEEQQTTEPSRPQASEQSVSSQNTPSNSPANPQVANTTAPSAASDAGNKSGAVLARIDPDQGRVSSTAINPTDDAAIKALDAKLVQNPNDANAFYRRGQLYAKNGVFTRAADDFDAAIRLNPKDPEAFNNRCWVRAMVADLKTALSDCDEALRLRPGFADALDSRGLVHLKLSMSQSAITDYDAALKVKPNQASSLYGRGIGKLRIGKAAEGNADIAAAKAIDSGIADEFASYGIR